MKTSVFLALFLTLSLPQISAAEVKGKNPVLKSYKKIEIPVDTVTPKISKEVVDQLVPKDINAETKSTTVVAKIADRGFQYWYNNSGIKETALGNAVETAQNKLSADVEIPGESNNEVNHKFSFKVEAFQGLAKIEYTGWLKAAINYDTFNTLTDIQLKELLFADKNFYVNHRIGSSESLSSVGMSWNW
ncbi:MAG: hypothetical protein ACLGGX_05385 [Bdellovibrionia bacterium]